MKLICFSHAGGSAEFFLELKKILNPMNIEVVAIEYAGHGRRMAEPAYNHFDELVREMLIELEEIVAESEEYALLGYSMGSVVLAEVVRNMHNKLPSIVFIASHGPKVKYDDVNWSEVGDAHIKKRITGFGGLADKLVDNRVYWRVYGPIYRNDFRILDEVEFDNNVISDTTPAVILYSAEDELCANIKDWNKYFTKDNIFYEFEGGHFWVNNNWEIVADIIKRSL